MLYSDTTFNVCVRLALSNTHLRMYGKGKKVAKVMIWENWVTGAWCIYVYISKTTRCRSFIFTGLIKNIISYTLVNFEQKC